MAVLKALWAGWTAIARKIANVQARLLLSAFYFCGLGPFAIGVKMFADPLQMRSAGRPTWSRRDEPDGDPEVAARRQF
jgi:hypothetical protein